MTTITRRTEPARPTSAEPAPETGFRWVAATELKALKFPEANEAVELQEAAE